MEGSYYLSLKKKVSPLICATASKTTGSLQMSIGVTGPWVGGRGLPVGTPVFKEFTNVLRHTQSKSIYLSWPWQKIFSFHYCKSDTSSNRRAPGCLGCHHGKVWSPWWKCKWVPLMLQGPASAPNQGRDQTHGLPPGTNCILEDNAVEGQQVLLPSPPRVQQKMFILGSFSC